LGLLALKPLTVQTYSFIAIHAYDDLLTFKKDTQNELKRIGNKIDATSDKADKIAAAITAFEDYSYQYNVTIVGVPQAKQNESYEETASLCLKIFAGLGVQEISMQDLDIAHRVPRRDNGSRSTNNQTRSYVSLHVEWQNNALWR
jgi:hypothetical protein